MIVYCLEFLAQHRYLLLPIKNGSEKIEMQLLCEGEVVREFDVQLATSGKPDWWAYYDIRHYQGKKIVLRTIGRQFTEPQVTLVNQWVTQSDRSLNIQDLYQEQYRPQLHFTPKRGWSNDPNGLIFAYGTWHLFFQHNPLTNDWGAMHWGHATSSDLIHWIEQPVALYPKSIRDAAWSGGAVLDLDNTSRLQTGENPSIVLSFTSTGRGECLAYSLDRGETFREYEANPILAHQGRDPKIIWFEPKKKWIMIVYEEGEGQRSYDLYDSSNLTHWRWLQHLPGWYECPEFFSLPILDTDLSEQTWVVYGSTFNEMQSAFQVGSFDGEHFIAEGQPQMGHAGPHFYAAQIFSHAPDDRKIMLGWLREANYPGMPFGNGMSLPLELSLRRAEDQLRLCFYPVKELDQLRTQTHTISDLTARQANDVLAENISELMDIELIIEMEGGERFQIDIGGYPLTYSPEEEQITFAGKSVRRQPGKKDLQIRLLVDRSVTEIFIDHGWGAFASMTIFDDLGCRIHLEGKIRIHSMKTHSLESIWV
jgi:fructan beta-fructosidase